MSINGIGHSKGNGNGNGSHDPAWWRQATVYQIYPRSFCDYNGDGIGDLKGITSKVPYLAELGVDAVWLCPFYPSPMKDGGYDVTDYRNVDPQIGTLEDFDELMKELKKAGIKCIVDIVPNHCSDQHVWFKEALASPKGSDARKRFIFRDGIGAEKSQPPNDWLSNFGGSAWDPVNDGSGQFYFHLFDTSQPDFNWKHQDVRDDFLKTLRFWGDRGVSGFRVDVAMGVAKNIFEPYAHYEDLLKLSHRLLETGKGEEHNHPFWDRDEVFEVYKEWRKVFNEYDPPLTAVAEAVVAKDRQHLYASHGGLGQCFNFDIMSCPYNAKNVRQTIEESLIAVDGQEGTTTWVLSNHDTIRHATRYGIAGCTEYQEHVVPEWLTNLNQNYLISGGKGCDHARGVKRGKAMTLLILALPGSTYIYQGEELGLFEVVDIPESERQDPTYFRTKSTAKPEIGRDGCRVPLPWTTKPKSFGFSPSDPSTRPHLPMPDWFADHAAEIGGLDGSVELYKQAFLLRKAFIGVERIEWVESEEGVLRFKRGDWEVLTNLEVEGGVDVPKGEVVLSSAELQDGKVVIDTTAWVKMK